MKIEPNSPIYIYIHTCILNPAIDNAEVLKVLSIPMQDVQRGIQTGRIGGEGKRSAALKPVENQTSNFFKLPRHIQPKQNMVGSLASLQLVAPVR